MKTANFRAMYQKDFGANLTIVLLLSFGLGTAALLYTALDRLLLHPLKVARPETLVRVAERRPPLTSWEWFPYSFYEQMRGMRTIERLAVEADLDTLVDTNGSAQPVDAHMVSGNYFTVLGVSAESGRTLGVADDQNQAGTIPVVLSHRFWVHQFGRSQTTLGSDLLIQGHHYTVVGIMSADFYGTTIDSSPDLWLPLSAQPLLSDKPLTDPDTDRTFSILGRLRPDTTIAQAQAEFSGMFRTLQKLQGDIDPKREGLIVPLVQGSFALREQFRHALMLLLCGLAMMLLMVCASVAGVLLAREVHNQRDTAVRIALGASRANIIVRALLRSTVLGIAGACGGIAVAFACAPLLLSLLPAGRAPLPVSLVPDAKAALAALALALLVSLLFGVIPACIASRVAPQEALRSAVGNTRPGHLRRSLLIVEVGATLVLLVGTGLLIRTFYVLRHTSPGFDVEHLIVFTLNPALRNDATKISPTLATELQQRIQAVPGVRNASLAGGALMQRIGMKTSVALPGQRIRSEAFLNTSMDRVSNTYFETMAIPILSGRGFSAAEATHVHPTPTVVNEAFARTMFPHEDPIGKTFGTGAPGHVVVATNVVVGVAGDSKYRSLREALLPIYYSPLEQETDLTSQVYLYVRTWGEPTSTIAAVKRELADLDAQLPFSGITTMQQQVTASLWQERMLATLASIFAVICVLMTMTGLYGLLSYDVNQRTREFGIRNAVGARRRDMALLVVRELARIVVPGLVVGMALCAWLTRIIAAALYGIKPFDAVSVSSALLTVVSIALVALWAPMWRAMNIEPAEVLRQE